MVFVDTNPPGLYIQILTNLYRFSHRIFCHALEICLAFEICTGFFPVGHLIAGDPCRVPCLFYSSIGTDLIIINRCAAPDRQHLVVFHTGYGDHKALGHRLIVNS